MRTINDGYVHTEPDGTGRNRSGSAFVHMGPFGTGPDRFQTLCIQSFSMLFGHLTTPFTLQMHSQLFLSPLQRPLLCCFDRKGFLAVGLGRGKNGKREGNAGNAQRSPRAWLIKFIFHREPLRRREQLCRHLL